jgi:hypothetical protein
MSEIFHVPARRNQSDTPSSEWSLYGDGHVIAGAIVERDELTIEAHILLDGTLLYRSRHTSRSVAEQELGALRGHWENEGWVDAR